MVSKRRLSAVLVCLMFVAFPAVISMADLTTGLVAYWPLDGNAEDVVGGIVVEVMGDPEWLSGADAWIGKGTLLCDGQDDQMLAGDFNPSDGTDELTISLWVTLNEHKETMFLKKGNDWSADGMMWQFEMDVSGDLSIGRNGSAIWFGTTMPLEEWVHLAVTVENDTAILYINGEPLGDGVFIMGTGLDSTLRIGATQVPHRFIDGMLDEVLLYNRALSADEIKELNKGPDATTILSVEPIAKLVTTWGALRQ
ncbi:LamG domain-containing protein [Candidatus Poribacteria bacterium]